MSTEDLNDIVDYNKLIEISQTLKQKETTTFDVGLTEPLDMYQRLAVEWMYEVGNCMLADEVGMGKSPMGIGLVTHLFNLMEARKVMVVVPTTVIYKWVSEFQKFNGKIPLKLGKGPKKIRKGLYKMMDVSIDPSVMIIGYETFRNDAKEIAEVGMDLLIFDEGSHFKSYHSSLALAVRFVAGQSERVVILNATPVENNVMDFYSAASTLYPRYFPGYYAFRNRYCRMAFQKMGKRTIEKIAGFKRIEELREKVDWMMLRRNPEDVGMKYPDIKLVNLWVGMTPGQMEAYRSLRSGILRMGTRDRVVHQLAKFTYLFLCCDGVLPESTGVRGDSGKIKTLLKMVKALLAKDEKVVIFSKWRKVVNMLCGIIEAELGVNTLRITGFVDNLLIPFLQMRGLFMARNLSYIKLFFSLSLLSP